MNRREFQLAMAWFVAAGGFSPIATAAGKPRKRRSLPNWKAPTAGGQQLWGDVRYHAGYRIQRHAITGHHRLLSPEYTRQAWGTLAACEAALAEIRQQIAPPALPKTATIYLHGLFRTRWSMGHIARAVSQQTAWQAIVLGYPSTRGSIADHAAMLDEVIEHLDGVTKIHLVAHSLGNLVIRRWLQGVGETGLRATRDIELGRMVMLGPPNHRPALARALVPIDRHKIIAGVAGDELNGEWSQLAPKLATPRCDFGILAGGLGDGVGHNPLIPGDDDMIVGVDETRLAGARDFRILPVIHATMMDDPVVQQMTASFLQHGYFESPDARTPLEKKPVG